MKQKKNHTTTFGINFIGCILFCFCGNACFTQVAPPAQSTTITSLKQTINPGGSFITNIGQYGKLMTGHENMGAIQYGYEGLDMPVLFTPKGLIHLQRKIEGLSHREKEKLERRGTPEEEIEGKTKITDQIITMEWVGANPGVEMVSSDKTTDYHTYGMLKEKALGYKKITYKNIYPGIDIVYLFTNNTNPGFEYSLVVNPGADLSAVKMKFGGDVKSIKTDNKGQLVIRSDINGITATIPVSYYGQKNPDKNSNTIKTAYKIIGNEIGFSFPQSYDTTKAIVIDPFVTATGNLTGFNAGKAKDVDFDYAGNIYVSGGGDGNVYKLAKYNAAGILQWTFNGSIAIPAWTFGPYYGGWVVEKPSGNIYMGQGFNFATGFQIIRLTTTGLYDNFITTGNPNFRENWKMYWNCNAGTAQIITAGGGTNSNINLGVFSPPSLTVTTSNITGISPTAFQDMTDMVIDPVTSSMYTIYASGSVPTLNNAIYKHNQPYSAATIAWNVPSGFPVLQEAANRPYLAVGGFGLQENSANMLAVNAAYLFYWDGKNLKAFDKNTGAGVGTPLTIAANLKLMQGGIIADACNNIFVGESNGLIKVYKFTGAVFDDAAAADIPITGFAGKAVYDLAYNETAKLLYACGDGFIASVDVSAYCPTTQYTLNIVPDCVTASAVATVSPAPPAGSTITYVLYTGATQIASNTTGVFTGLSPAITYTIVATINLACSGTQTKADFIIPGPAIAVVQTNTTCGAITGSITATGSGATAPYTYSIDGATFQGVGIFNGLAAGIYTVTVKDANGCKNTKLVTIINTDGPTSSYTSTNANCGSNNGTITANASAGTPPYQYSINGVTFQSSNFFTGLLGGQYTLTVKDATNCTNATVVIITSATAPSITAIPASATCGLNNGTITAFGSGGTAPLEYSINGNIFQPGNVFNNLTPGLYTVTVRDVNNCIKTTAVTVANSLAPTVTAVSTPAACSNVNGTITATGNGGVAPLEYSINGSTFQTSNIFTGLAPGIYTVTVRDATGCTNIVSVTVNSTGGPTVTAIAALATCNTSNGSITVTASGTVPPYQYSVNGTTFQAGNTLTGLAAGNYVALARDANGCIGTFSITVNNIAGPLVTAVSTPASCTVNDGTITATGTGGTPPFQYSIDGIIFQAGNVFTGLSPNTYTVTIRDANLCTKTTSLVVANASGLTLTASTISTSCNIVNGEITGTAGGGVAPLLYSINGSTYQPGNSFTGLSAGIYTLYVRDANNCLVTKQVTVASVSGTSLSVTTINATCGSANGVIIATGSGGLAPLKYSIDGVSFQSSGTFLNVAVGTYTVSVKDSLGCIAAQSVSISNTIGPGPGIASFTVVTKGAYICNGGLGKITNPRVNGSNCGACTFSLNFGPFIPNATQLFLNLNQGTYTVTAKDASGCTKTIFATIGIAVNSTATATVIGTACNTSNGSITITGIGPNTPYHASITGIGGPWITFDPTYTFTGLAAGAYTIILADDESFDIGPPITPGGCLDSIKVIVPSFGGLSVSTTQLPGTCGNADASITATGTGGTAPYSYNINDGAYQSTGVFNNLAAGIYYVSVKDATGCINVNKVTLVNPPPPDVTAVTIAAACNLNNGTITATGTGGTAPLQYSIDGFNFQAGTIFTNLAAGNYTLYVKDVNGCYSFKSVTVANTPLPQVTAYTVAATCNNNDGSILATGSSGTAPYEYSIDGTVFQSSTIFSGLAAGFYTITVKDARDCINTSGVNVGNTGAPTFNTTTTAATCGNANGIITITAVGGTAPYLYSADGIIFQPSNIFTGLLSGPYTVTVKDVNGCLSTKAVLLANINGPQVLTAVIVNAACGLSIGSITAAASGGVLPLQFSINGTTYQASNTFSGLAAAGYSLYVKDANGCTKILPVTLLNLAGPTLTASSSPASCNSSDGTITANVTGGTGILTYSKNGVLFQASNIFTGLSSGPYTITVKDARGCSNTSSVSINSFAGAIVSATSTDATCGNANGTIIATGSNGTIPYQYSIDGTTFQASNIFNGLAANTYNVTIKDVNNCTNTTTTIISNTNGATVIASSTNESCGNANGTITATGAGGTAPYKYSIDGTIFQSSNFFNGLVANTYTVTIKDANNCTNTTTVSITNLNSTSVTATATNATCGSSNGSITAVGANGAAPYQYSINGTTYQPGNIFTGLAANTYTITVKDANNCTNTTTVTITNTNGATVTAIATNATCGNSNGTITATGAGGTTPYQYSINGTTFQAGNIFNALAANNYTVTIKDANNCTNTTLVAITNITGATVTAIATNATCGNPNGTATVTGVGGTTPYQYSIDGTIYQASNIFNNLPANNYTVSIKDANNCINTTTVTITNINGATVTTTSTNATCGNPNGTITATGVGGTIPYQYSINGTIFQASNIFNVLAANNYTVTIKDANNCINTTTVTITNTNAATVTATSTNATCGNVNGSITATGAGGATPYQYSINGTTYQASNIFNGLAANNYTVTIKDANNCTNTTTVIISNINGATVTATSTNASCGNPDGTITATGAGGTTPYQYSINGTIFQLSNIFNALTANTYTVTIKDANNCINTTAVTISNTNGATVTATSTNASCGNPDGTITATGVGGTAPYQYSINGTTFQLSNIFNALAANNYTVTIKDANNCTNTTVLTISSTNGATVTATSTNASCGNPDGTITATGVGGTLPYQYSINGTTFQAGNIFNALAANNYTVTIKDANNCTNTTTVAISNTNGATVTATSTNASCSNPDGTITATGVGGTAPYQYSINGTTFQAGNVFNVLTANTYTVTIKDANNCINTTTVAISNTNGATVTATSTNATCGNPDGTITATGVGGTAPYQYSINGTTFQAGNIFNALAANTYTVTIKDANNCINTTTVTISNTGGATVTATSTNASCGNPDGTITATGIGGTAPYQYSINGTTFQARNIFNALAANTYTVTIKDVNNCTNTTTVTISNTGGATVTATSTNASCGNPDGTITATGVGGTAPYQYSINGTTFQAGNIFNALAANTYTVTIKDANNCINTTTVTITNTNGAMVTATSTNASCGNPDGTITATGVGGTAPYQYSINGTTFQAGNIFNALTANTYTVTIKDANNCTNTTTVTITNTNGATVTATSTNASCGNPDGTITATGVGGTAPYQYSINGTIFQASNTFNVLAANTYTVTIKDANNCTNTTTVAISNSNAATVTASATNAACGIANGTITATGIGGTIPYQFSINGVNYQASNVFNGLVAGSYTIRIKDASNCINTTSISISANNAVTVNAGNDVTICEGTAVQLAVISNGTNFSWTPTIGLSNPSILNPIAAPATTTKYYITATTGTCSKTDTCTIFVNPAPIAHAGKDSTICFGKNIQLTGTGGSVYLWSPPDYLSNTTIANPILISQLPGRFTYFLTVKDANGCNSITTDTIVITVLPVLKVFAGNDTTIAVNQPLQLNAIDLNNSGFINYNWSPPLGLNNAFIKNPVAILNSNITYSVTAQTIGGCAAKDDISIRVFLGPEIYVPSAFSPNQDGLNDILKPILIGIKELRYFAIYNRYGEQVFKTSIQGSGWDGMIKGKMQNTGAYVWVAEAEDYKGNIIQRKGSAVLVK